MHSGIEQYLIPFLDQVVAGLEAKQAPGQLNQLGSQSLVACFGDAQILRDTRLALYLLCGMLNEKSQLQTDYENLPMVPSTCGSVYAD